MKKLIYVAVLFFSALAAKGQNTQLPTPEKLKLLQPADLVITDISLISASFNTNVKAWVIKVNITVKNAGQIITAATDLKPWVKKSTAVWKPIGSPAILIGLKPGESLSKEYAFVDKLQVLAPLDVFSFKVQVDAGSKIKEGNETNNESSILNISPSN
jgi:hypothetical protein